MKIKLYKAGQLRTRLIQTARNAISRLYDEASEQISKVLHRTTNTAAPNDMILNVGAYREVEREARKQYRELRKNVQDRITSDMYTVSNAAFNEFNNNMVSYGMPNQGSFISVPKSVIQNILNGTVYEKPDNLGTKDFNWNLSKALWGDERKTMEDIHKIIATGVASGAGSMKIAEELEKYMKPGAGGTKFDWSKVYPGVKKQIDYNASRLARTMLNHAYQQSFKQLGEVNPWVSHYIWNSAFAHGRTCQVCMDLDGQLFSKDNDPNPQYPPLPLDHPNGLCDWTYEFDRAQMRVDLVNYARGEGDPERNKQIDEYNRYLQGG